MQTPIQVANTFLSFADIDRIELSPMKLLKLVYIAHGWHLAYFGKPLIDEPPQAWKYGPVIESLYHGVKHYGNNPIRVKLTDYRYVDDDMLSFQPIVEDQRTLELLKSVWDAYKDFSAVDLSTMTHRSGTPWAKTWHEFGGRHRYGVSIDNELIKNHYDELRKTRTRTASSNN